MTPPRADQSLDYSRGQRQSLVPSLQVGCAASGKFHHIAATFGFTDLRLTNPLDFINAPTIDCSWN